MRGFGKDCCALRGGHTKGLYPYIFRTVSTGVLPILTEFDQSNEEMQARITQFKQEATFVDNTGAGANIKSKLHTRIGFAREFFSR